LGLGRVLGVATQNSTHTQNPTFSGFDTQKIPNTQKFWVQLFVCMDNILHNLHNYTPKNHRNPIQHLALGGTADDSSFSTFLDIYCFKMSQNDSRRYFQREKNTRKSEKSNTKLKK
jgi:hypothetical protein